MTKSVTITNEIVEAIQRAVNDPNFDASNVTVFEARLASTEAIDKRGTLFEGSRITPGTLMEAAETINADGGAVPLHTLHQNDEELPVGRVFQAETQEMDNGETEIRGLFFIPNEQEDLIASVNNSVIDEVSVGLRPKKLLCSECEFDYLGEDSDIINILERTCDNEHTIGENGVFARFIGLDRFMETSLVSRGALKNAKILSRAKQQLGQAERERLAANIGYPEAAILTATFSQREKVTMSEGKDGQGGGSGVDLTALTKQIVDLSAQVAARDTEIENLKASVKEKDQEIERLNAKVPGDDDDPVKAALGEDKASIEAKLADVKGLDAKLSEHCHAALVAAGTENPTVPDGFQARLDAIENAGMKLHQAVASQHKSHDAAAGDGGSEARNQKAIRAFQVRPRK